MSEANSKFLGKIEEEEEEEEEDKDEESVDSRIKRWSPFHENESVTTPITKRSAEKTNSPISLKQWNQRWFPEK